MGMGEGTPADGFSWIKVNKIITLMICKEVQTVNFYLCDLLELEAS